MEAPIATANATTGALVSRADRVDDVRAQAGAGGGLSNVARDVRPPHLTTAEANAGGGSSVGHAALGYTMGPITTADKSLRRSCSDTVLTAAARTAATLVSNDAERESFMGQLWVRTRENFPPSTKKLQQRGARQR